ncbi:chorismate mutase [Streptomyces lasiicapitis]|uniref:chorismate mutase n=1 Tax=Streptomyces lasiicapitis TaxID=1923961 RepID=UPI003D9E2BEC
MRLVPPAVRVLAAGGVAAALLVGGGTAVAAPAASPTSTAFVASVPQGAYAQLHPLSALSAQRLATADLVAAAKYGTGSPIDDPAREQQVLDAVARQAAEVGADPAATVRIFRDQIEANKVVQRALHRKWDADPASAPTERPDLAKVRAEINRINGELVRAIAAATPARTSPYCSAVLTVTTAHVRHEQRLDALHTVALLRASRSLCG